MACGRTAGPPAAVRGTSGAPAATGCWPMAKAPEVVTSDGIKQRVAPQSLRVPHARRSLPLRGIVPMIGLRSIRPDLDKTGCQEAACRHRRLMAESSPMPAAIVPLQATLGLGDSADALALLWLAGIATLGLSVITPFVTRWLRHRR